MSTLRDVLRQSTGLPGADVEWLHRLVGDWQIVADLSFADLTLWVPTRPGTPDGPVPGTVATPSHGWVLAAHARPSTGPNFYHEDVVGEAPSAGRRMLLDEVLEQALPRTPTDVGYTREQYVPVVRAGHPIAVLVRHTDLQSLRQQGGLEVNYLQIAQSLVTMIAQGTFPAEGSPTGVGRGTPRVGDGVVRLTAEGRIEYASPNAVSALRRLGHTDQVTGADLSEIVTSQLPPGIVVDEAMPLVLTGRAPWGTEIETRGINLTMRSVPLLRDGTRTGALLLMRDVSELRRRDRELLSKDATIREIHHRVKNNLQTVAALLRLQSRRMEDTGAKDALQEAGRRLATVALVHDTLSHSLDETVDFDDVAVRIGRATVEVASRGASVLARHTGTFGRLRAEDATPLAMVLAELVHNAAEHGYDVDPAAGAPSRGEVVVDAQRRRGPAGEELLTVTVADDGQGLPGGKAPARTGLGVQIVEALIADLRGEICWETAEPHGTVVRFLVRLRSVPAES
ncbi:sensor histidine kinase [Ornithinicoccus halotolerans]|uniref:sensor histidine kinase n=1 Tax=Ornithinicoccus halotolerans TaxID=1748220 RepID=UPI001297F4C0|nr:PAS domain-containing sensor histidine kinase [Ornithinicoccus halotolerans]